MIKQETKVVFNSVLEKVKGNVFKGYDPYDIMSSSIFNKTLQGNKARLLATQINKALPLSFRKYLGIKEFQLAKANSLFILALCKDNYDANKDLIKLLLNDIIINKSKKFDEFSIGFPYPLQISFYSLQTNYPSLIFSLFAARAFIEVYKKTKEENYLNIPFSLFELIKTKLPKKEQSDCLAYSYTFDSLKEVYNATAKIGTFFCSIYKVKNDSRILDDIDKILKYLASKQRVDGTWAYSDFITYSDCFHTIFILDAIYDMLGLVDTMEYREMYNKGLENCINNLFIDGKQPKHIHPMYERKGLRKIGNTIETDIRDCANAIAFFNKIEYTLMSEGILNWTIQNMYDRGKSYFYFYKERFWTNKIEFIRPQAWMLYALSTFNH